MVAEERRPRGQTVRLLKVANEVGVDLFDAVSAAKQLELGTELSDRDLERVKCFVVLTRLTTDGTQTATSWVIVKVRTDTTEPLGTRMGWGGDDRPHVEVATLAARLNLNTGHLEQLLVQHGGTESPFLAFTVRELEVIINEFVAGRTAITPVTTTAGPFAARSARLMTSFIEARGADKRKKIVRAHKRLCEEARRTGIPEQDLSEVLANHRKLVDLASERAVEALANNPLRRVMDELLAGSFETARDLLREEFQGDGSGLPPVDVLDEMLAEMRTHPGALSDLDEAGARKWRTDLVARHNRIERHLTNWLETGDAWMTGAEWPLDQRRRAGRFLLRSAVSWLDPDFSVDLTASENTLERLMVLAHEVIPLADIGQLSARPQAVNAGGTKVVSWLREPRLYVWVAFSEGAVAVTLDLSRFRSIHWIDKPAAFSASAIAAAWFLDSVLRTAGVRSSHFSIASSGDWTQTVGDFDEPKARSTDLLQNVGQHDVSAHLRTLPDGRRPSREAIARAPDFLRGQMGPNQTYVRASSRRSEEITNDIRRFTATGSFLADVLFDAKHRPS